MFLAVGEYVFSILKQKIDLDKYFPYNDILVAPHNSGKGWNVHLRALISAKVNGQKIFYSRSKAVILIDDSEYIISFTPHCIDRIQERMFGKNKGTYGSYGDVFEHLHGNPHYEICKLEDGTMAISLFVKLNPNDINTKYYQKYIKNFNDEEFHYYRLGYFPLELSEDYAICKTLLCPGYHKTPEFKKLKTQYRGHKNSQIILENISSYGFAEQLADATNNIDVFDIQRYLCNCGVPQTISSDVELNKFTMS